MTRTAAREARRSLRGRETLQGLAETFKMLGDETRLKICMVLERRELCVGEIAELVGLTESGVSHQLRIMKALRLVTYRREGKMTFYMLDDEHIEALIRMGMRHVSE